MDLIDPIGITKIFLLSVRPASLFLIVLMTAIFTGQGWHAKEDPN